MYASERFRRRVAKLHKSSREADRTAIVAGLHAAFDACTSALPRAMQNDVFEHLMEKFETAGSSVGTLFAFADDIGVVIDLLSADYDERADPLDPGDWDYFRDLISEFANELDMDLVSYVMRLVVEKGKL